MYELLSGAPSRLLTLLQLIHHNLVCQWRFLILKGGEQLHRCLSCRNYQRCSSVIVNEGHRNLIS